MLKIFCSGKPVCRNNVCSSNSVKGINVHPTISVKASNIFLGNPVCRNNVRSSKPVEVIFFQSKFANVNILPCKPVLAGKGNIKNSS